MRKIPTQPRAKARVETILDAAETILIKQGVSALSMERIAETADVSIGSLYQYFQGRDEIFQQLSKRYYEELDTLLRPYFTNIEKVTDFIADIEQTIRICWDFTLTNIGYRTLFFEVAAWEVMREVDWRDTRLNAERIANAVHPLMPNLAFDDLLALGMIIGDAAASAARMATRFPELKDAIFAQFIQLVTNHLFALMRVNTERELKTSRAKVRVSGATQPDADAHADTFRTLADAP